MTIESSTECYPIVTLCSFVNIVGTVLHSVTDPGQGDTAAVVTAELTDHTWAGGVWLVSK